MKARTEREHILIIVECKQNVEIQTKIVEPKTKATNSVSAMLFVTAPRGHMDREI